MRDRLLKSVGSLALTVSVLVLLKPTEMTAQTQDAIESAKANAPATALKTPWGEPDLQGIWTEEFDTPLQRSPKYANQEFFTERERQELDGCLLYTSPSPRD